MITDLLNIQQLAANWVENEIQRLSGLRISLLATDATSQKIQGSNVKKIAEKIKLELQAQNISLSDREIIEAVETLLRGIIATTPGSLGDPAAETIYEQLLEQIGCIFLLNVNAPVYIAYLVLQKIKKYARLEEKLIDLLLELSLYLYLMAESDKINTNPNEPLADAYRRKFVYEHGYDIDSAYDSIRKLGDSLLLNKSNITAFDDYINHAEKLSLDYFNKVTTDIHYLSQSIQEVFIVLMLVHKELKKRINYYPNIIVDYEEYDLSGRIAKYLIEYLERSVKDLKDYMQGKRPDIIKTVRQNLIQLAAGKEAGKAIFRANKPSGTLLYSGVGSRNGNVLDCGQHIKKVKPGDYVAVSASEVDDDTGQTINYRTITAEGTNTVQVSSDFLADGQTKYIIWRDGSPHYGKYKLIADELTGLELPDSLDLAQFEPRSIHRLCGLFLQMKIAFLTGRVWPGQDISDEYFDAVDRLNLKITDVEELADSFFMEKIDDIHDMFKLCNELGLDNLKNSFLEGRLAEAFNMDVRIANSSLSLIDGLASMINS